MGRIFNLLFVLALISLVSFTGCSSASSVTGSSAIKNNRKITVSADKKTIKVGETAVISVLIENADGSNISGFGALGTTGTDQTIIVSYSSNSRGTVAASSDSLTLAGSTTTTSAESFSGISFHTTVTATFNGILTVSVSHIDLVASVNITVLLAL